MGKIVDIANELADPIFGLGEKIWDETVGALWDSLSPDVPEEDYATLAKGLQKGIDQPRRITFGRDRIGGVIAHQATIERDEKHWVQLIVLINGAPIDALEDVYIANKPLSDYPAESWDYSLSDGNHTSANSKAVSKMAGWTNKHIGCGQAHVFIELENNREIFPDGISDCEFLIRGARIWDPRDSSQNPDDATTWTWSQNAVLCALHYIRFYGAHEVPYHRIPLNWWIAAANVCDENAVYQDSDGVDRYEPRYTCNGTFRFTSKPIEILNQLERCFAGKIFRQMGQWFVRVGAWYGNPTYTINQSDVMGNVKIKWHADLRDRANIVRATFTDPNQHYERTDAPPVRAEGYIEKDNQPLEASISLPFVRSATTAQRLATIHLELTRLGSIELPLKHKALGAAVGRTVYVDLPSERINKKVYRVVARRFRLDGGITLTCVEDSPLLWADDLVPGVSDITPNSDYVIGKPSPIEQARVEVDGDGNGIVKWTHPTPLAVHEFDVEFYIDNDTRVYKESVTYTQVVIPKLALGTYTAKVFARNIFGQRSKSVAIQFTVSAPTNPRLSFVADYNQITLTATLPAIGIGTQFEWQFLGSNDAPQQSDTAFAQVYNRIGLQPMTEYHFQCRAVNHLGNSDWVQIAVSTTNVDLTEFIHDMPLAKLSQEAQDLINDLNTQVDRLRPETENNLPSLVAKNIEQIHGLEDVTKVLDSSIVDGIPAQIALNKIKLDETALAVTDMQKSVFDVTAGYTNFRHEYERRTLNNERLIDAAVFVDAESGTIVNRAFSYTDTQFSEAVSLVDGAHARISFESRRIKQTEEKLVDATAQIELQAGQITQRATHSEVDAHIAGAIAALTPAYSWQFNSGAEGFAGFESYHALGYLVCKSTLNSPAISLDAVDNPMFRLRVRKHENSTWLGHIQFNGGALFLPEPTSHDWEVIQIDATGTAGYTGIITWLQFSLGHCDLDFIEIGKRGANDLALKDITSRTTTIEQELDAGTGRMGQYATTAWVSNLGYQTQSNVQTLIDSFNTQYSISAVLQALDDNDVIIKANAAQTWIDGANATIRHQVIGYLNEEDGVNQKLTAAEQNIDALAGEVQQSVTQIQGIQLDLADKDLNQVLDAYNQLLRDNALAEHSITLAHAEDKLTAVTDDVSALSSQSTQLIALHNQSAASIDILGRAFANERQASGERTETLRAEILKEGEKSIAEAKDFTRAITGYCVDSDGNRVDTEDATACELAGHTWVDGPVVERSMSLTSLLVDSRGYQTSSQVNQAISTFDAVYGVTAALQSFYDNGTLEKANAAERFIAGAAGYIKDQITVFNAQEDGVDEKFANVSSTLDAMQGEINQSVVQVQGLQLGADAKSLDEVITAYNALLQNNELQQLDIKLALAQDQLKATTNELESIASYTLELGAIHQQNSAIITSVAKAFANERQASVTRDERFAAFTQSTQAAFSDVIEAFAELDSANLVRDQTFTAFAANTETAFADTTQLISNLDSAMATQRQDLVAKIEQDDTSTLASAISYTRAAVGYCIDAQGNLTSETDATVCVAAGHSWVDGPLAEFIRKLQIENVNGDKASISDIRQAFETQDGRLIARGGFLINNQGRATGVVGLNDGQIGNLDLVGDVIRQGVQVGDTFIPTSFIDNRDPSNPVHVFRGRLELGDFVVASESDIRGLDGQDGQNGLPGPPGRTYYTWIKYADDAQGNGLSDNPDGKAYIGVAYNKLSHLESNNPNDYAWSKIKGEPGNQGIPGDKGEDGQIFYTWVVYSDNADGTNLYQTPRDSTQYIGIANNKTTATESTNPADYHWSKIKGADGTDGIPGDKGEDGQTLYTWVAYSDSANGTNMYQVPTSNTQYMGIAVNKLTSTESTNPSDYTWVKFKGADGSPGEKGDKGDKGDKGETGATGNTGARGAGRFVSSTSTGSWSDALAHAACGGRAVVHDVVTLYKQSDPSIQHTKHWTGSAWHDFALHIHGDQLVDGTVIAHHLASATGTFSGRIKVLVTDYPTDLLNIATHREGRAAGIYNTNTKEVANALTLSSSGGTGLNVHGGKNAIKATGTGNVIEVRASNTSSTAIWTPLKVYAANGYKPFTGVHEGLLNKNTVIEVGDIVCDVGLINIADVSNALCEMGISHRAEQRNVRGVFTHRSPLNSKPIGLAGFRGAQQYWHYQGTHDLIEFNALGEGVLNVCGQGGDIEAGDYLCSSDIPGKAMRQADQDFERPFTIAQARHSVTFTSSTQI
ncbi:phage tail protein, partial [Pseudoalteromonas luteoviolacea]|uniref:phage tail protein n=1 Tax=Pseudoalteromonas luteoviolacea TaxID=43657 RepID=UPI001B487B84